MFLFVSLIDRFCSDLLPHADMLVALTGGVPGGQVYGPLVLGISPLGGLSASALCLPWPSVHLHSREKALCPEISREHLRPARLLASTGQG